LTPVTIADTEKKPLKLETVKPLSAYGSARSTGMDIGPILDFARRLADCGRSIWLRFVLVPGLTDRDEDIAQIAKFSAGLGNVQRVDVLPFHQMDRFKWKELKYNYTLDDVQPPSLETVEEVRMQFRAGGLKAF
jgi:pyruvate formate lyase activating enzyme